MCGQRRARRTFYESREADKCYGSAAEPNSACILGLYRPTDPALATPRCRISGPGLVGPFSLSSFLHSLTCFCFRICIHSSASIAFPLHILRIPCLSSLFCANDLQYPSPPCSLPLISPTSLLIPMNSNQISMPAPMPMGMAPPRVKDSL